MNRVLSCDLVGDLGAAGVADPAVWIDDYVRTTGGEPLSMPWWHDVVALRRLLSELQFRQPIIEAMERARDRIEQHAPSWWTLLAVADRLYRSPNDALRGTAVTRPGPPPEIWGELGDLYPALVYLTGLEQMVREHRRLGIPEDVTRDTAFDMAHRITEFHTQCGRWGTNDRMGWFNRHLRLKLFALGRLQFEQVRCPLPFSVFRGRAGEVAVLVEDGRAIRADGMFATADDGCDEHDPRNWVATLEETADAWIGYATDRTGAIQPTPVRLSKDAWQLAMQRRDFALSVHIPSTGKLDPAACAASLERAADFFPAYVPEATYAAAYCNSWLMDPQLQHVLEADANIVQFQGMFHLVPVPICHERQTLERVFGKEVDPRAVPCRTSLQRRILAHMEAGGRWRHGGGVHLLRPAAQRSC